MARRAAWPVGARAGADVAALTLPGDRMVDMVVVLAGEAEAAGVTAVVVVVVAVEEEAVEEEAVEEEEAKTCFYRGRMVDEEDY
jgi:hypothetical protein